MQDRYLRREEVERLVGLGRSSLYRLMRQGAFPTPIRIGGRAVRWSERELEQWLAARPRATGEVTT